MGRNAITLTDGHRGNRTITGASAITNATPGWSEIQVLEDATFTLLTDTDAHASADAMTGFVVPAGIVLCGHFTAITLTSGKVRAYNALA